MAWTDFLLWSDVDQVIEKLKNFWSAAGITLALVSTMGFTGVLGSPALDQQLWGNNLEIADILKITTIILFGGSLLLSGWGVILCFLFYSQINQIPHTEKFLVAFLNSTSRYFWTVTVFFQVSVTFLIFGVAFWVLLTTGRIAFGVVAVAALFGTIGISVLFFIVQKSVWGYQKEAVETLSKDKTKDPSKVLFYSQEKGTFYFENNDNYN